jgi:energy-coupling factor transporter ATP-binding protein EcfA2
MTRPSEPQNNRATWAGKALPLRLSALDQLFVKHDAVKRILDYIQLELPIRAVQGRATGLLIVASSGAGKSRLVEYLKKLFPDEVTLTLTKRLVVSFKIPPSPSPKSLGEELLLQLGDPEYNVGTAKVKFDRIRKLLKKVGTIILTIDDFQDVPAKRGVRGVEQIACWIRDLCDIDFPGIVIALGTEEAVVVRDAHGQLLRRMQARLELPAFTLDSDDAKKRFKQLLNQIDGSLPMAERSNLDDSVMMVRLYRATNGSLDYLMKLLGKAIARAVARGSERIELRDLEQGFCDQHQVAASGGNPFSANYKGDELTQHGQIFYRANQEKEELRSGAMRQVPAANKSSSRGRSAKA